MKVAIGAFLALLIVGCGQKAGPGTADHGAVALKGVEGYALGQPITYENATFIPVLSTKQEPTTKDDTITLSEAKKNKWVEIIEMPGDEQVNMLKVRNTGPKPILLISGELLLGGKQDRIVAKDTVVPPGETKEVEVFCVEHGRWEGASTRFSYSNTMAPDSVRKAALYGKQEDVWAGVAKMNETPTLTNTQTNSLDYPGTAGRTSLRWFLNDSDTQKKLKAGIDYVQARLSDPNIVGVVFVLNGEIQTFEFFDTPSLFKRANKGVLESFLAEAAAAPKKTDFTLVPHRWQTFVENCLTAPRESQVAGWTVLRGDGVRGGEFKTSAGAEASHSSFEPTK